MHIETIRLTNFKTFKDFEMKQIPKFCVIVGANGTGKSTLFSAIAFLKHALTYNVSDALDALGGFDEVISRGGREKKIAIELQIRMEIGTQEKLVTYGVEIRSKANQPYVAKEYLRYRRHKQVGNPFNFLKFENGSGYALRNEDDFSKSDKDLQREEQKLDNNTILAIKGLGQFERFTAARQLRQLIENWHISDFHISDARGSKEAMGVADHLSPSGDNLQRVAYRLSRTNPDIFSKIVKHMAHSVPGISKIVATPTQDRRIILTFADKAFKDDTSPFIDTVVSDGTLKMFAYLLLLYDPQPHPVLCIEEPENQLYPTVLTALAEEMEDYARRGGQVFVSTHSPDFLNAVALDSVYWLVKQKGYSKIYRARDNEQIAAYMSEGDKMGNIWKDGFFDGADPK